MRGLAVRVGLNLQPGQRLAINALLEHAPLVRAVAAEAYAAGAQLRRRPLLDQHVRRAHIEHAAEERSAGRRPGSSSASTSSARDGGALLAITGNPEPELFADLDGGRVARVAHARASPRRACGSPTGSATGRSSRSRTRAGRRPCSASPTSSGSGRRSRPPSASTSPTLWPPGRSTSRALDGSRRALNGHALRRAPLPRARDRSRRSGLHPDSTWLAALDDSRRDRVRREHADRGGLHDPRRAARRRARSRPTYPLQLQGTRRCAASGSASRTAARSRSTPTRART